MDGSFEYALMLEMIFEFSKQFLFVASAGAAQVTDIVGDRAARTTQSQSFKLQRAFHSEQAVRENSGGSVSNYHGGSMVEEYKKSSF